MIIYMFILIKIQPAENKRKICSIMHEWAPDVVLEKLSLKSGRGVLISNCSPLQSKEA